MLLSIRRPDIGAKLLHFSSCIQLIIYILYLFQKYGIKTGPFISVDGYWYLVTMVAFVPKYCRAIPICHTSAVQYINFLFSLLCHHFCSNIHITNQGREFINKVEYELHNMTNTTCCITSVYHPQLNGLVEFINHTMQMAILKGTDDQQDLIKCLYSIPFSVHSTNQAITGMFPMMLMYDCEPIW